MDAIRCLIVDDEYPARLVLTQFVEKVPTLRLVGACESGAEALAKIQTGGVDLLFLDIQMPDITGVNLLKMLTVKPLVVLTTAYSDYAIESYQLDVLDYLLKPFSFDRFMQSVGKAMQRLAERGAAQQTPAQQPTATPAPGAKESETERVLIVKADHKIHRIKQSDILYIEGLREYVTIHVPGEKIITLESLRNLEETLPRDEFMRVHKSYIVRLPLVRALYGAQLKLEGVEPYIPVGKSYKDAVQRRLFGQTGPAAPDDAPDDE